MLSDYISIVANAMNVLAKNMDEAGEVKLNMSLGTANLSVIAAKKNNLLTLVVAAAAGATSLIKEKRMVYRLKKRRDQQSGVRAGDLYKNLTSSDITVRCRNNDIPWIQAFSNLEATGGKDVPKSIHLAEFHFAAERIENEKFVSVDDLNFKVALKFELIEALLTNFPVMHTVRGARV